METTLFTPRHIETNNRPEMQISVDDENRFKDAKRDEWIRIYDTVTCRPYLVQSAACGLDCYCDAVFTEAVN